MKIIILSSHTDSLFWFRMDMMQEMIKKGCEVIAVGNEPELEWSNKFQEKGIKYRCIKVNRNGLNPFSDFKTIISIKHVLSEEKPNKIFIYQAKTIVYGSIAAKLVNINEVYLLFAGLGSVFRGTGFKNRILKKIMKIQYKISCKISKNVFFQNEDDEKTFIENKLVNKRKIVRINGSGVNLEKFKIQKFHGDPICLFIGRLIKDKGIVEYLEAARKVREQIPNSKFLLVGPFDTNPSALSWEELNKFIVDGTIEYYGEKNDVRPYVEKSSIFVLPSYHEGTPKSVLEAMAMGKAIITTDTPGCKETVNNGENGYLVKMKNVEELTEKIIYLLNNKDVLETMSINSFKICKDKFDVEKVNNVILKTMNLV
ncbi:glycosyltransferase family 4 protein [Carnobacterium maltaromaticum]|uniref:glycosyltransferase family 4 protein n=1 Tax=Carnobacterium maltaromaticum TaxID=2751 RepID=UPI0011441799|nr:glycosyltransferase family 4 protein [Carnobacterium maltaromaticum]GED49149.1 glycosyl transferase [Carnobacterium maltaromaticum]